MGGGYYSSLLPLYILAIIAYACSRYNPNIINADTYDADAYLTSIYNVHFNIPYTVETTGIYGHYAIFFKIPMLLFGGDVITISRLIAIISAITMAAFCYAVNNLIHNNYVRCLVILAALLEPLYALPFSYYQTSPNRYLFPALLIALMSYDMKNNKKITVWLGNAVACLGVLWNFESGVVTVAAWFVYLSIKQLQNGSLHIMPNIIRNLLMMLIEVMSAIGIMVIYNVLCGGKPCISAFFYPYNHHLEDFALPIAWGNYAYIYVLPILLSMFMWSICSIRKFDRSNNYAGVIGATSTMAIGLFSYYMNRFASCNVWLIVWEFSLLLGILIEKSLPHIREIINDKSATLYVTLKSVLGTFAICILSALALGNIFSGGMQQSLYEQGTKNVEQMEEWAKEVESVVPKDTYATGGGTAALYSILEWDTGYHINDLPNLVARTEAYEKFINELYEKEAMFIANDVLDLNNLLTNGNFEVTHSFNFGSRTYYYVTKK